MLHWRVTFAPRTSPSSWSSSSHAIGYGLVNRHLADPLPERGSRRQPLGQPIADARLELLAPCLEDVPYQLIAADGSNGGQDRLGQGPVVGREEVLRRGRQVVHVARAADAVAAQRASDQAGRLERPELLEHAGATGADAVGDLIGRGRAAGSERVEDLAA